MIIKTVLFLLVSIDLALSEENIVIKTPLGSIEGVQSKSSKGDTFYSFLGVPYAEPPTGEFRFREPQAKQPWGDKVLKATKDGKVCPQPVIFFNNSEMSEDCLFMNIHTRHIKDDKTLVPVLFYVHGGGYFFGSGHSVVIAGPDFFLNHDVVLVSINYRLGPLGFASTGSQLAPGNFGFKDMVMALKWVQENIKAFGGDPDSVTIFGHSAGGMSISHLMVSPMTKGLFHKAIAMSGSATTYFKTENQDWTKKLAKDCECPIENEEEMMTCLKKQPWEKIISTYWAWETYPFGTLKWNYEIEKDFGQEVFITDEINNLYEKGDFQKVPFMTGIVPNEFDYVGLQFLKYPEILQQINSEPEKHFPIIFDYPPRLFSNSKEVTEDIRKVYLKNEEFSDKNFKEFGVLFSDAIISFAVNHLVNLVRKHGEIFVYEFEYKGIFTEATRNVGYEVDCGVVHADDLQYLFSTNVAPRYTPEDKEHKIVDMMTSIYVNFAASGNPNFNQTPLWTPSNSSDLAVFHIGENLRTSEDQLIPEERYQVWEKLIKGNK
ncbi:hypothetical protein ACFFRR_003665 [Megaselia abdita]